MIRRVAGAAAALILALCLTLPALAAEVSFSVPVRCTGGSGTVTLTRISGDGVLPAEETLEIRAGETGQFVFAADRPFSAVYEARQTEGSDRTVYTVEIAVTAGDDDTLTPVVVIGNEREDEKLDMITFANRTEPTPVPSGSPSPGSPYTPPNVKTGDGHNRTGLLLVTAGTLAAACVLTLFLLKNGKGKKKIKSRPDAGAFPDRRKL